MQIVFLLQKMKIRNPYEIQNTKYWNTKYQIFGKNTGTLIRISNFISNLFTMIRGLNSHAKINFFPQKIKKELGVRHELNAISHKTPIWK